MVKFILIKSPDEWATTKQACRDELVVYLFFSSHIYFALLPCIEHCFTNIKFLHFIYIYSFKSHLELPTNVVNQSCHIYIYGRKKQINYKFSFGGFFFEVILCESDVCFGCVVFFTCDGGLVDYFNRLVKILFQDPLDF